VQYKAILYINHNVGIVSRFMERRKTRHLIFAKRILRYIKDTIEYGYSNKNEVIYGYSDTDRGRDQDNKKSTSSYLFMIGAASITQSSKKQKIVVLLSCEVEYVSASYAACQALWKEMLLELELDVFEVGRIKLLVDNNSAIDFDNHSMSHGRSKNIERNFHFQRNQVNKMRLELEYCKIEMQIYSLKLKKARFDKL